MNDKNISPAEIQKYLKGMEYPAKKDDLVAKAKENDAPEEVVRMLEDMPLEEFGGPQDVMKGYGGEVEE